MEVPEQKLARGGTAAIPPRAMIVYIGTDTDAYTFNERVRHAMVRVAFKHVCTITLPPVSMVAGQIYSVYIEASDIGSVDIVDAGDDPDFTTITLVVDYAFCVVISNGTKWMHIYRPDLGV